MRTMVVWLVLGVAVARAGEDPKSAQAKVLYEEGMKWFNLRDFKASLAAFKEGYLAKPAAEFLFNIGQCHRMLGNLEEAIYSYRAYLRERPEAPNCAAVEKFIRDAEDEIGRRQAAKPPMGTVAPGEAAKPVPTPSPPQTLVNPAVPLAAQPPPATPVYKKWWLWTAVAAVAVVGAGVGVGVAFALPKNASVPSGAMPINF